MSEEQTPQGRISARRIDADNVVSGTQTFDLRDPLALMNAVKNVRSGAITADEIKAINVVAGIQITNEFASDDERKDTVRQQLGKLSDDIETLDKNAVGWIEAPDKSDLNTEIERLKTELDETSPRDARVRRAASNISDIIKSSADSAENAGRLSVAVSGLALQGAALFHLVSQFFPG